jgi:hypothetical protein
MFNSCLRQYYWNYYGSWGGWDYSADPFIRELYIMKNLNSVPMWIGSSVHETVKWVINRIVNMKTIMQQEEVLKRLHQNMDNDWHASQNGFYRDEPKKTPGLIEHYYKMPVGDRDFEQAYAVAEQCIQTFFQHPQFSQALLDPTCQVISVEQLDKILVEGVTVWVICDLILRWRGKIHIIDWKTGKSLGNDEENIQLAIYALYPLSKGLCFRPEEIVVHLINLNLHETTTKEETQEMINWAESYILESANKMVSLLRDDEINDAQQEDFPLTDNQNLCRWCNFRKACGRLK